MNRNRRREVDDEALSHIVSFSSAPPPPGEVTDVHSAKTAVAALPDAYLVDLLRGKAEPITARYQVLPESDAVEAGDAATVEPEVTVVVDEAPVRAPSVMPEPPRRGAAARVLATLGVWLVLIALSVVVAFEAWRLGAMLGAHYGR